jgi:hypothetical protein
MSGQPAIVRDPTAIDEAAWRRLWAGYGAFCETRVPDTMTARTWQRMLDPLSPIFGRLAVIDRTIVGFTWPYCTKAPGQLRRSVAWRTCSWSLVGIAQ